MSEDKEVRDFEGSSSSSGTPASCVFGLELTKEVSTYNIPNRTQAWRLKVTVTDCNNVDPNIFMYLRGPGNTETEERIDAFQAVCSPVDLEEYPAGEPLDTGPSFFRVAEVDLLSRSRTLLEETWNAIVSDVEELIQTLVSICELQHADVVRIGTFDSDDEADGEPQEPEGEGDSISEFECPEDLYTELRVTESNDPEFPVDAVFVETGSCGGPPSCDRSWECASLSTGHVMKITTSIVNHEFVAYFDDEEMDSGKVADGYKFYVDRDDCVLKLEGVE